MYDDIFLYFGFDRWWGIPMHELKSLRAPFRAGGGEVYPGTQIISSFMVVDCDGVICGLSPTLP